MTTAILERSVNRFYDPCSLPQPPENIERFGIDIFCWICVSWNTYCSQGAKNTLNKISAIVKS